MVSAHQFPVVAPTGGRHGARTRRAVVRGVRTPCYRFPAEESDPRPERGIGDTVEEGEPDSG